MAAWLLAVLIQLSGVEGSGLRARAFFDSNNVKVGDPLTLTIDFLGEATFSDLHPPALSKAVDRNDWKLDDASAKTDTYRSARRLTYRVRPMRPGVLWFPALDFGYAGPDGSPRKVRANAIPVHAKGGAQVVVSEMGEDENLLPQPDELIRTLPAERSTDADIAFAWRKACAKPTAAAFAALDFPEAQLNAAACYIKDGNWAEAMKIYCRLEWTIGQTPAIERGIVAALALRYDNPRVELPVWRQVARPLLRFGWKGRCGLVLGGFAALAILFWLLGRGIRAVACVTVALIPALPLSAQGIFEQMEREMRRMQQQMHQSMNFSFGNEERERVKIEASVSTDREKLQVGSPFSFVISLDAPKTCSIGQISLVPSERFGLTLTGKPRNLSDVPSSNPSNSIRRLEVPVRYDVPFRGKMSFAVNGMVSGRESRRGGFFSFSFSNSFACQTKPVEIVIEPLPTDNQPSDFSGIVSEGLTLQELPDLLRVETNDVITITYRMRSKGYVPADFMPEGAAFEWGRDDASGIVEYKRYLVADGVDATPKVKVVYYDPRSKSYRTAEAGGTGIRYVNKPH